MIEAQKRKGVLNNNTLYQNAITLYNNGNNESRSKLAMDTSNSLNRYIWLCSKFKCMILLTTSYFFIEVQK